MIIEINLLGGQKKRRKGGGGGISMPKLGEMFKGVKDPLLLGAVGAWAVVGVGISLLFVATQGKLQSLQTQEQQVRADAERFSIMLEKKREAENLQDSLETELQEIRGIDSDRYVWPHVLEEVTKALPDYTWLVGVNVVQAPPVPGAPVDTVLPQVVQFMIDGRTSDIGAYTRFLRNLAASPWIGAVVPGANRTVVEDDKALTAFSITATFVQADSAFIRTVSVAESVR